MKIAPVDTGEATFAITDEKPQRLRARMEKRPLPPFDRPAWAAAAGPSWREIAAVPTLGIAGRFQYDQAGTQDPWLPELKVGGGAGPAGSHLEFVLRTRQWSGLLAFLAMRDFERSAVVLDALMAEIGIRSALVDKVENPLAATASALVTVATGRLHAVRVPEQWLWNLANWFPGLPDGPIIVARLLLAGQNFGSRRADAKALLLDACHRGVPVYSLSVDWLAQSLAMFADEPDGAEPARKARRLAQLTDPTRAFTVLRIPT